MPLPMITVAELSITKYQIPKPIQSTIPFSKDPKPNLRPSQGYMPIALSWFVFPAGHATMAKSCVRLQASQINRTSVTPQR